MTISLCDRVENTVGKEENAGNPGVFFTKKVTPIIGVFPSANFPQGKYFSPSNQFFPKKSIFPTLIQSIVMRFSE